MSEESMPQESTEPDGIKPPEEYVADDYRVVYANNFRLSHTSTDIQIDFVHLGQEFNTPIFEMLISAILPPVTAKLLSVILAQFIKTFEEQNGEILMPKSLRSQLEKLLTPEQRAILKL